MRRLAILGLGSVLFGGCYYTETLIGVLSAANAQPSFEDQQPFRPIVVPDSVAVGEAFTAVVHTLGGGGIGFNSTRVDIHGNVATITPYDTYKRTGWFGGCEAYLSANRHEATVRFMKQGQATVSFRVRESEDRGDVRVLSRIIHVY